MWIVSAKGKQNLEACEGFTDLWSGLKKIPKYKSLGETDQPVKTRIIVPVKVRKSKRVFGVIILESAEKLDITDAAKNELNKIADTISIIFRSHKTTVAKQKNTIDVIKSLEKFLIKPLLSLTKPKLFIAFPINAERDVTEIMVKTLKDEFNDKVDLVNWKEMDHPGNINQQLIDAICACRYAICYLSERNENGEFRDNSNVIFEAGMFHGRTDEVSSVPSSWIPVREKESPKPPFDFAQERMLIVQRNKSGSLKEKIFVSKFRSRIKAMLNSQ